MKHFTHFLLLLVLAVFSTSGAWAVEYNLATLTSNDKITLHDGDVIYGKLAHAAQFTIADGATITLRNVNMDYGDLITDREQTPLSCYGNCTIILEGTENYLQGRYNYTDKTTQGADGIYVTGKLTIKGDGELKTVAGLNYNGIYAEKGLDILSGTIIARGSDAGIACENSCILNIYGGNIKAYGGDASAGIGGGLNEKCGTVNIYGGTVYAEGGSEAPGIGSGQGDLTCIDGGTVNIYGGYVEAHGGNYGAGIGAGDGGAGGTITISGGEVKAYGGVDAAGIGGGEGGAGGTIKIYGGTVYAEATGDDSYGAGIGGGQDGAGGTITISGGDVTAYGGTDAAGIGGGEKGASGNITISGGTVYAESTGTNSYGAGIGAGMDGDCSDVYISGGVIHAIGGSGVDDDKKGHAVGTSKNTTTAVHFADDLVAWESENISSAEERSYFCCSRREVHINICDHNGATFTDISNATHTVTSCPHCALTNKIEHHFVGADGKCTQCQGKVFAGSGTSGDPYQLTNATYPSFVQGIQYVNDFSGKYFQMTEDITTDKMADGTFSGTLDGNGHTITLALGSESNYLNQLCALFYQLSGATIENLRIAGSIYSSTKYNAGIACSATGTNTIRGCVSNVSIHSNKYGDCTNGGLIGFINTSGSSIAFEGCAFLGQLIGANATNWGGFIGWRDYSNYGCSATFTDCLFAPTTVNVETSTYDSDSRTFCRSNSTDGASFINCYYTKVLQAVDGGTKVISTSILPDDIGTAGTNYGIIQAYTNGLKCDDLYYVHSEHFSVPTNAITGTFAGNWCTYYNSTSNLQVDDNTTIYTISAASGTTATLHEVSGKIVKAGQGVILKSTGNITLTYTSAAATDADYTSNLLEGVDAQTTISSSDYVDKVIYTLAKEDADFGFFKYYASDYTENTTLGANKAFLPMDAAVSARGFVFSLEGETTGVNEVNEELRMKNEEWAGAQWYTIDGRKLSGKPSAKGLYIVNGKKFIIK